METKPKRPPGRPRKSVEEKPRQFSIRLVPKDHAALEDMALLYGLSISQAAERAIRREMARITPAQKKLLVALKKARSEAS